MEYTIRATNLIHWDTDGMMNVKGTDLLRYVFTVEVYAPKGKILPIVMVGAPRILRNEADIFRSILHTRVILTFNDPLENPINDLVKMINDVREQEFKKWAELIEGSPIDGLYLHALEMFPEPTLNKSCEIRDIAKQHNLLK